MICTPHQIGIRRYGNIRLMSNIAHHPASLLKLAEMFTEVTGGSAVAEVCGAGDPGSMGIRLEFGAQQVFLNVFSKGQVHTLQARDILWNVRDQLTGLSSTVPFVLARAISAGAREMLKAQGVGFCDDTGTLFFRQQNVFVYLDKGLPPPRRTGELNLFVQRRAQGIHTLLREPTRWWGVTELAQAADVGPATASEVLSTLDRYGWVRAQGQGPHKKRQLSAPGELLDAWTRAFVTAKRLPLERFFVPELTAGGLEPAICGAFEAANVQYAITHQSAAQRLAPLLTHTAKIQIRAVEDDALAAGLKALGARPVDTGWNLGLLKSAAGDLKHRERVDGVWYASLFSIYLDLQRFADGRSVELAQHLRSIRIGF